MKLLIVLGLTIGLTSLANAQQRSFYDSNGHFAGQSSTRGNSTSYTNSSGHYSGQTIRNSNGTTSSYDGRGHFIGSTSRGR
jgi:hypothetical protein